MAHWHEHEHDERFKDRNVIGGGYFGKFYKIYDTEKGSFVAVKCILFDSSISDGLPSTILREISVLKELDHPNVVRLLDVVVKSKGVKIVFEFLNTNLYNLIEDVRKPIDPNMIKGILYQILQGVSYCHSHKILHRDLTPENLLLEILDNKILAIKIADFGHARIFDSAPLEYSIDKTTIPYKAPELLLDANQITTAVDIWAVGCIFAEMVMGKSLFPQSSEGNVLWKIIRIGVPSEEEWEGVTVACLLVCSEKTLPPRKIGLSNLFPNLEPDGLDLLSKMLCFLPSERISACDALQHPYLEDFQLNQ